MFTVLIPFHGESAWLARCLAGFSTQDFHEPFEVVVIDNDTPGPAPSGVFERYREHLQLSVVRRSGLSSPLAMSSARNRGLALAQYEWIVHMDADCVPGPEHLHRLHARITAARGDNLLLFGVRRFINSEHLDEKSILDGSIDWSRLPEVASPSNYGIMGDRRLPELVQVSSSEQPWAYAQTCNLTHRFDAACGVGGFDEAFSCPGEPGIQLDTELSLQMWRLGYQVGLSYSAVSNGVGGRKTRTNRQQKKARLLNDALNGQRCERVMRVHDAAAVAKANEALERIPRPEAARERTLEKLGMRPAKGCEAVDLH